jgi:uncharacterized protein (TIGR02058 family)
VKSGKPQKRRKRFLAEPPGHLLYLMGLHFLKLSEGMGMEKIFFIEIGMGTDLHGQNVTKAAVRAVQNAIHHNSMPGLRSVLPDNSLHRMKVNVRLAVPCDRDKLDHEAVKAVLPYGEVTVEVVDGGMVTSSGVVLPDKDDKNDLIYVVIASVEVGY